jgi:hypothetical protein
MEKDPAYSRPRCALRGRGSPWHTPDKWDWRECTPLRPSQSAYPATWMCLLRDWERFGTYRECDVHVWRDSDRRRSYTFPKGGKFLGYQCVMMGQIEVGVSERDREVNRARKGYYQCWMYTHRIKRSWNSMRASLNVRKSPLRIPSTRGTNSCNSYFASTNIPTTSVSYKVWYSTTRIKWHLQLALGSLPRYNLTGTRYRSMHFLLWIAFLWQFWKAYSRFFSASAYWSSNKLSRPT